MAAAIAEVGRGHRKTDLMDRNLYPTDLKTGSGTVNMPYLAAVIRLADEMDISASRNLMLQYAGYIPEGHKDVIEFQKHRSLQCNFSGDSFVVKAETNSQSEYKHLLEIVHKVEETLEYCQNVVKTCTGTHLPVRYIVNEVGFTGNLSLIIDADRSGDTLTITLAGKLDNSTSSLLDEKLAAHLGGSAKNLVLDFKSLTYITSAGLRIIIGAKKKTIELRGKMNITNISEEVMAIFRMTGLDSIINR
jgi:anti-anti-sigma factor